MRTNESSRRLLPDGREAPTLMVVFECPACGLREVLDAYVGVPLHNACATTSGKIKPIMRARSLTAEAYR